jgi:hypothetical protein
MVMRDQSAPAKLEELRRPRDLWQHLWSPEGWRCIHVKRGSYHQNLFFRSDDEAEDYVLTVDQDEATWIYHACATFQGTDSRKQANVQHVKCYSLDIDCGSGKPYSDVAEAQGELQRFCAAYELPAPLVVASGHGLHCYWVLERPVRPEEWRPGAELLKRACERHGLRADHSRTTDCASILRPPGTWNKKTDPAVKVRGAGACEPIALAAFIERLRRGLAGGGDGRRPGEALDRQHPRRPPAAGSLDQAAASVAARPAYSDAESLRIREALASIPVTARENRDTWFRIGCALHWLSAGEGWEEVAPVIWNEWSGKAKKKFDEADQLKTWKSFERGYNGQLITLGTLFHIAKAHGWRPSAGGLEETDGAETAEPDAEDAEPDAEDAEEKRDNRAAPDAAGNDAVSKEDFIAYLPMHTYIYRPTGEIWVAASVNSRLPPVLSEGKSIAATKWLDNNAAAVQMTWAPGEPELVHGKLIKEGGWYDREGARVYNLYKPPRIIHRRGDVTLWQNLLHAVFPEAAEHITLYLAHRVQKPGEKINHALVLGGAPGIGKDTILEPVKQAVGPWNFSEIDPQRAMGRFNGYLKAVLLRINEAHDLGEINRYAFYDHLKAIIAAPPDTLRIDEKNIREYAILNLVAVIITTNYRGGIYLPSDDRRHFVAWSPLLKEHFPPAYFNRFYKWLADGGNAMVADHLATLDISAFDPKAPPPQTEAFWQMVYANRAPETAPLADALDALGNPDAVTLDDIRRQAASDIRDWLDDKKNARIIPHRLGECDYESVRNPAAKDGLWTIAGRRQVVYARRGLTLAQQLQEAQKRAER